MMVVSEPMSEPMIHRDIPGGLEDLQEYVMEVLDGIKDHCIRKPEDDPNDTPPGKSGKITIATIQPVCKVSGAAFFPVKTIIGI